MYRSLIIIAAIGLLSGCESLQKARIMETSSQLLDRTGKALQAIGQANPEEPSATGDSDLELKRLFDQSYIDPLTRYLRRYENDESRAAQVAQVRLEQQLRCEAVAKRYRTYPASEQTLQRYRAGYSFSCPQQVEAFALGLKSATEIAQEVPDPQPYPEEAGALDYRQLNDCYLLTSIRNYSEALKACREPAERGDLQAQANMALISHAFQDYTSAAYWAQEAAPGSGEASYLLGRMYSAGQGVGQNHETAEQWYTQAASQGHSAAKAALEKHSDKGSGGSTN